MPKKILVLGSGMCAPQLVAYLDRHGIATVIGNRTLSSAQKLAKDLKHSRAEEMDVENKDHHAKLEKLIEEVDGVVSMLPYLLHIVAAELAVKHKKHFFTTSYSTDAMKKLEESAKAAGVIIINECGVDPGTDHMSAMRVIDSVRNNGGKVISFKSYCGGLPVPEDNNNPFGYKLSWAPRGVLLASRNDALFLEDGQQVSIPGKDLFDNYREDEVDGIKLESYPNRDSVKYKDIYGLGSDIQTIIRGTYRYPGWCKTIKKLADLGYLRIDKEQFAGKAYADVTRELIKAEKKDNLESQVAAFLKIDPSDVIISNMKWIGIFSETKIPAKDDTHLDALCHLFKEKLVYAPGERDMIVMKHTFVAEYPDRREHLSTTLVYPGEKNGATAMATTVGVPVAIAIRLVLENKIKLTGLQIPIIPELYNPILDELEKEGIKFVDKVDKVEHKKAKH